MAAQAGRVTERAFSADQLSNLDEQIARAKAQFDAGAFTDIDVKVQTAMDKLHSLSDMKMDMNMSLVSQ